MKKITLLIFTIISFFFSPSIFANSENNIADKFLPGNTENFKTFTFKENGITFSIFQNGEFDFYINRDNVINTSLTLAEISISYNSGYNYDAYVQYDDYGAIVQIENVPIYYDYYGRVKQIGRVKLNYYNHRLSRIGGLGIYYNPYGYYSHHTGFINSYNLAYNYHPYHSHFIRPIWNNCVVSYNPYRKYYKPYRYTYYHSKKHHNKYYNNPHYNKKRSFRNIDSRVSNHDKHGNKIKRNQNRSQDKRLAVNNRSSARRQAASYQRNSQQTRERKPVKYSKKIVKRNYNPSRHASSSKTNTKRNSQQIYSRSGNVVKKNNLKFKDNVRNRAAQVKPKQDRNSQYNRSVKNSVTKRNSSYKPSNNNRSFDHKRSNNKSKKTVAERSNRGRRKSS